MDDDRKWTWWQGPGAYSLDGPYGTREEAIARARANGNRFIVEAIEAADDDDWFDDFRNREWLND